MSSLVILVAACLVGALSAIAFVIVLRSGLLHPGEHHGHHAGDTGPVPSSLGSRLEMLRHAVEDELHSITESASHELEKAGAMALRSASVDPREAKPSPKPGVGGAASSSHIHLTSEEDGAEMRDALQEGKGVVSVPPNHPSLSEPEHESGGESEQSETPDAWGSAGGPSGAQGKAVPNKAAATTVDGTFSGRGAASDLAKCMQVETDGRVRLRARERLRHDSLAPRNRWAEVQASTPVDCPQRPGRDYAKHPVTIFQPGRGKGKVPDGRFDCPAGRIRACPYDCFITGDGSKAQTADVTLSVVPGSTALKASHCPLQKQALFSMENEVYYPNLALNKGNMGTWDFMGTTHLASDVPLGYGGWYDFNYLEPPSPKTASALAVAVISNCAGHNGRLKYVRALQKAGVTVHQMGRCDHNFDWQPPSGQSRGRFVDKIDMLRPYKFTLAFENTNTVDYITEKFFQPLVAGSVPVYMGAPNSEVYAPGPRSVIRTDDFAGPNELAKYLLFLASNEEEYNKLLEWKYTGVSEGFQRAMAATTDMHSQCRLCRLVRETLEVEVGDREAMSDEPVVQPQTKADAPGAKPEGDA